MIKYLYWRMYQDKESTQYQSVILTETEMKAEASLFFDNQSEEDLPPVFEPVMMTEQEFNALPEFDGF